MFIIKTLTLDVYDAIERHEDFTKVILEIFN